MTNASDVLRVETSEELTDHELMIAQLLSEGNNYVAIAELLHCSDRTVKFHTQRAAAKIPGDLPAQFRVVAWYRGATIGVLGAGELLYTSEDESPEGEE